MVITRTWYLELNGVPLATPAWECPDLSPLLDQADVRGGDRVLPYVNGAVAYRRRPTVTVYTLPLDINGLVDSDGVAAANPFQQLITNRDYLAANLGYAAAGDGTVAAILHRGALVSLTGDVHFLGLKGSRTLGNAAMRTTFDISIPAGALA